MYAVVCPPLGIVAESDNRESFLAPLIEGEARTDLSDWTFYDTPDGRLFAAGLGLVRHGRTLRVGTFAQLLCDQPASVLGWRPRALSRWVGEWPVGAVRDTVAAHGKGRAILPRFFCHVVRTTAVSRDERGRIAVRLTEWVITPGQGHSLCWVVINGQRGHAKAFRATLRAARAQGWSAAASEPLVDLLSPELAQPGPTTPDFTDDNQPAGEALRACLTHTLASLSDLEAGVVADIDHEFLHQHRVMLRRVRALTAQFCAVFAPEAATRIREILAGWARCSGLLRDLDVWLAAQAEHESHVPANLRPGLAPLFAEIARERDAAQRELAQRFTSDTHLAERALLADLLIQAEPGPQAAVPLATLARQRTWKVYRKIVADSRQVDERTSAEAIHEVRIRCKKLRYLLDACGEVTAPGEVARLVGRLREVQGVLGSFNDAAVQTAALMKRIHSGCHPPDTILAVGALIAALSSQRQALITQLLAGLQDLAAPATRRRYRKLFRIPTSPPQI